MLQIFFRLAAERLKKADEQYLLLYQKHLKENNLVSRPRKANGPHKAGRFRIWWPVAESNHGHADFQSAAHQLS